MHEQSVSKSEINNLKINNKNINVNSTLNKAQKDSRNKKKKNGKIN